MTFPTAPKQGDPNISASCRKPDETGSGGHQACDGTWATNRLIRGRVRRVTGPCICEVCKHDSLA